MPAAKTKTASQIYAVLGSDDVAVKSTARELAGQLTPAEGGDFGCDVIDGAVQYVSDAVDRIHATIEALLTFPFFGGEKLVWLKSATFLADTVTGRSETVTKALDKLLAILQDGLPEGIVFLLRIEIMVGLTENLGSGDVGYFLPTAVDGQEAEFR